METSADEVHLATPSRGLNNPLSTLEEWVPICVDELKPIIGMIFDTLEEGGRFYKKKCTFGWF